MIVNSKAESTLIQELNYEFINDILTNSTQFDAC